MGRALHAASMIGLMTRGDRFLSLTLGLLALSVYLLTLTPSLSYLSPDGSELATVPAVLGLAHSPGYPLYTWLGYLFSLIPLGDVAHRINLMSAVMGALGIGGLYLVIVQLLPEALSMLWRRSVAALNALLFAFSLTFWSQAVIAEVYAPNIGIVVLTLLALLLWERTRRAFRFFIFSLLFGLSLGMHISDLGFAPAFVLFALLVIFDIPRESSRTIGFESKLANLIKLVFTGALGFGLGLLQFAWLPYKAGTLNDRLMLRAAPSTLAGLYKYTLGAFPQFKFAFPLTALPDRLVIYLDLVRQQFGLIGIALGVIGLFSLLFRRPRHFYLFVGMYLVHVWFFIQYRAFDLDVFFIPAHLIWAIFIAFGLAEFLLELRVLFTGHSIPRLAKVGVALLLLISSLLPLSFNWSANDFSHDTAIDDFYANVWQVLPQNAALVTQGGVFGYDAFYWKLVYQTRPDVFLPMLAGPNPASNTLFGRDLYSTTRAGRDAARGPGALPQGLLSENLWQVPVLIGEQPEAGIGHRQSLVLYHLTQQPPQLLAENPQPQMIINQDYGGARLLGSDLSSTQVESGAAVHLTLYWKLTVEQPIRVETALSGQSLEQHEVGFGLLERYAREVGLKQGDVIMERYWLVIPSNVELGVQTLTIRLADLGVPSTSSGRATAQTLATLQITNQVGTEERWIQIAQK